MTSEDTEPLQSGISKDFKRFYQHKNSGYFLYYEKTREIAGFVETKAEADNFLKNDVKPSIEVALTFSYIDPVIVIIDGKPVRNITEIEHLIMVSKGVFEKINNDPKYKALITTSFLKI